MARDARLWKRNLFVIPGGLLAVYSGLALLDLLLLRPSTGPCQDPHRILYHGLCYNVLPWLAALLLLGLVLVAVGAFAFRSRPGTLASRLEHGTPTHFALALLVSFAVVPILAAGIAMYLQDAQGTVFVTGFRGASFRTDFLLGVVAVVGICLLVPFALLLAAQRRLRLDFLAAAEAGDEPETFPGESSAQEEAYEDEEWPESRAAEHVALAAANPSNPSNPSNPAHPANAPASPSAAAAAARPGAVPAPIVRQSAGCPARLGDGASCDGSPVPGGPYCIRHACQGTTASGAACRNPAIAGTTRCRAHTQQAAVPPAGNP